MIEFETYSVKSSTSNTSYPVILLPLHNNLSSPLDCDGSIFIESTNDLINNFYNFDDNLISILDKFQILLVPEYTYNTPARLVVHEDLTTSWSLEKGIQDREIFNGMLSAKITLNIPSELNNYPGGILFTRSNKQILCFYLDSVVDGVRTYYDNGIRPDIPLTVKVIMMDPFADDIEGEIINKLESNGFIINKDNGLTISSLFGLEVLPNGSLIKSTERDYIVEDKLKSKYTQKNILGYLESTFGTIDTLGTVKITKSGSFWNINFQGKDSNYTSEGRTIQEAFDNFECPYITSVSMNPEIIVDKGEVESELRCLSPSYIENPCSKEEDLSSVFSLVQDKLTNKLITKTTLTNVLTFNIDDTLKEVTNYVINVNEDILYPLLTCLCTLTDEFISTKVLENIPHYNQKYCISDIRIDNKPILSIFSMLAQIKQVELAFASGKTQQEIIDLSNNYTSLGTYLTINSMTSEYIEMNCVVDYTSVLKVRFEEIV